MVHITDEETRRRIITKPTPDVGLLHCGDEKIAENMPDLPSYSTRARGSTLADRSPLSSLFRRELGDDFLEARITAERIPEGQQL
jgi:hypothetical protein